jgi:hypothetical protein
MVSFQVPKVSFEPNLSDRTAKHIGRIADLKGRLKALKQQSTIAMGQDEKSAALSQKVSTLEGQMSILMGKVVQLKECNLYMIKIVEAASEQLQCKSLGAPKYFCRNFYLCWHYFLFPGICLVPAAEDRRVDNRREAPE